MFSDFFYLGKITKQFGIKGELVVFLDTDEPEKYYQMQSVYLDIEGEPIPFCIEEIKIKNDNQIIVKFEDINQDQSSRYVGVELYLPLAMLPKLTGNKFYYHEVIGFEVVDKYLGVLGHIKEILDYPHQAIFNIANPKGEILLPIVDKYIINVDRATKSIQVQAPEDLIALYIGQPDKE